MDNFFYILIGIAWVAYSIYSARQKAIQKQQSSGLPPRGPSQSSPLPIPGNQGGGKSVFDDILRELTGESRPVPQQVVEPREQPVMTVAQAKRENIDTLGQKYEGHSAYKFINSAQTDFPKNDSEHDWKAHEEAQQHTDDENYSRGFNLRRAVIYSELLNRKYF